MDPQRWKQIDEIFHAALDREPSARSEFLLDACKDDESLRAEIEALIASHEKESSLFETPPSDLATELLVNKKRVYQGKIAHYEIVKKIGSGGMGEVYLAEDTRLNRKVALKLLPSEFTKDKDRIRRFEREARAVTALNHPYILTIYDIGQIDSSTFIASEYIDGETLRQRMLRSKIPLKEILTIIIQVAEALDAAHQAGIIHRDMKPENIMLRKDGYVKVLDFGLSKPVENSLDHSTLDTVSSPGTQTGIIVGTLRYMSPEQARGLKVDLRTDLFSLGIVLYEMITGRAPFDGATTQDLLVAILEKNPPSLTGEVPDELRWTVIKALAKDVEERYQTTKDLLADLKRVKKKIELDEELKRSGPSSIDPKVHKTRKQIIITSTVLLIITVIAFLFLRNRNQTIAVKPKPFSKIKLTRLTTTGSAWGGAISPDGKYVVYAQSDPHGQQSLFIKQLAADTETSIVSLPHKTRFYGGRRFSPDGNYIYYLTLEDDKDFGSLYQIPILGGVSHKLIENISFVPAISPDGKKLAFVRYTKGGECTLMIAQSDGTQERIIRKRKFPESYGDLEWSPDGKIIAAILNSVMSKGLRSQIVGIQLDGSEHQISNLQWVSDNGSGDLEWLPDGTGLILTKETDGRDQLYQLLLKNGELIPITNDPNSYTTVSLTKDFNSLVTTQFSYSATLWTASSDHPERANQLTSGSIRDDGHMGISWTNNKNIIYSSKGPGGDYQIWETQPDGRQTRITSGKLSKYWPTVSPDGHYIVYNTDEGDSLQIWRIDADGGNPKLLSGSRSMRFPRFTQDSKWIICSSNLTKGNQELLKLAVDGTTEKVLASHLNIFGGAVSPDGKQIAYSFQDNADATSLSINIISSEGGSPIKTFQTEEDSAPNGRLHWTPDGRGLAYIREENEVGNIYVLPIDGSARYPLTKFTQNRIHNFSWSLDGKSIAYTRGTNTYDIVLIQSVP